MMAMHVRKCGCGIVACCAGYHLNAQDAMHLFDVAAALCQQVTHEHIESIRVNWRLHCNSNSAHSVPISLKSAVGI